MQGNYQAERYGSLVDNPREDIAVELKSWLDMKDENHRADLAKALLAMSNSGGGVILIGFIPQDGAWVADPAGPADLAAYSQDSVNQIVEKYAEPTFQCHVFQQRSASGHTFPVVVVPGEQPTPIRSKRSSPSGKHIKEHTYYIRRPGPASAPIQTAREWDELIGRCLRCSKVNLLDSIRQIFYGSEMPGVATPDEPYARLRKWDGASRKAWTRRVKERLSGENPSRFCLGTWSVSYEIDNQLPETTCPQFSDILRRVDSVNQGLRLWPVSGVPGLMPYVFDNVLECTMFDAGYTDGYHSPFWRASHEGLLFLVKGHREDSLSMRVEPGKTFDLSLPIYRITEALLHAERLTEILGVPESLVRFRFSWDGLSGRELQSGTRDVEPGRIAVQDSVSSEIQAEAQSIRYTLPELAYRASQPLYQLFALADLGVLVVTDIVKEVVK